MKEIEKLKPSELGSWLNPPAQGTAEYGCARLEDDVWELKDGIYQPIGRVQLPVRWGTSDISPNRGETTRRTDIGFLTIFNEHFFEDPESFMDEDCEWNFGMFSREKTAICGKYGPNIDSETIVLESIVKDSNPFDLMMKKFIPDFLKLYDQARRKTANTESLQCIRKAFTDYRCLKA